MNAPDASARTARLHITTLGPNAPTEVCLDTYTCGCTRCIGHREKLVAAGVRPIVRQPFEPRPARRAA